MHKELIFRLMYRGASYADNLKYQRCIDLWNYALRLRVQKDTILPSDSCFTSVSLANLYLDLFEGQQHPMVEERLNFDDVLETVETLLEQIDLAVNLLRVRPVFKKQQDNFDMTLKVIVNLLYLLDKLEKDDGQKRTLYELVRRLLRLNLRSSAGHSVLHLAVSANLESKSSSNYENLNNPTPDADLVRLLLDCGAPPDPVNLMDQTPLHLVCTRSSYCREICQLLLQRGAHVDRVDVCGLHPAKMLTGLRENTICPLQHITLKCLAARRLRQRMDRAENGERTALEAEIPYFLGEFVGIH